MVATFVIDGSTLIELATNAARGGDGVPPRSLGQRM
jgi:hypothetical protein